MKFYTSINEDAAAGRVTRYTEGRRLAGSSSASGNQCARTLVFFFVNMY